MNLFTNMTFDYLDKEPYVLYAEMRWGGEKRFCSIVFQFMVSSKQNTRYGISRGRKRTDKHNLNGVHQAHLSYRLQAIPNSVFKMPVSMKTITLDANYSCLKSFFALRAHVSRALCAFFGVPRSFYVALQ